MSTIKVDTVQSRGGGAVTLTNQSAAKATLTFNGSGTVAIRKSFNIASLVDDSSGNYSVNSTSSMDNSEYALATSAGNYDAANPGNKGHSSNPNTATDSSIEITSTSDGSSTDTGYVSIAYFGDLA